MLLADNEVKIYAMSLQSCKNGRMCSDKKNRYNILGRRDSLLAALLPPVSNHSIAWFQKTLEPSPGQWEVTESIVET